MLVTLTICHEEENRKISVLSSMPFSHSCEYLILDVFCREKPIKSIYKIYSISLVFMLHHSSLKVCFMMNFIKIKK